MTELASPKLFQQLDHRCSQICNDQCPASKYTWQNQYSMSDYVAVERSLEKRKTTRARVAPTRLDRNVAYMQ